MKKNHIISLVVLFVVLFFSTNEAFSQDYYLGRKIDENPENKIINDIEIVILPPLSEDFLPIKFIVDAGNFLHINTQKSVIEKEIAVKPGDTYNQSLINEILVYLTSLKIVAQAKCYPVETFEPDVIDLIFEIRDEWSLSVSIDIGDLGGGEWKDWFISINEKNLFGWNREIGFKLNGNPYRFSVVYLDFQSLYPVQFSIDIGLNFNNMFEFDNFDLYFDVKMPLVKTLRKFGFDINYHFKIGNSNSSELPFPFKFREEYEEGVFEFYILLPNYYKQNTHEIKAEFSYLIDSIVDSEFKWLLSLNFMYYWILDDAKDILGNDLQLIKQYEEQLFPIKPYNSLSFSYILSKIEYINVKDYKVFNRNGLVETGFRNTITLARADMLLGSPSNSTIIKDELYFLVGIADYLFIISGNYLYEIDINDYAEVVSHKFGINQVIYFRPLVIGQFVASFNLKSNIGGDGKRDVTYYLGGNVSSDCWVRGTLNEALSGQGFINFSIEYRTNGVIKISRSLSIGFAIFYDFGVIFTEYGLNIYSASIPKHSIGIGIRIDYGTTNMIIIDFAYEIGEPFSIRLAFSLYQIYRF